MPVIKSAKKKLRQDRRKTLQNKSFENLFKKLIKEAIKTPSDTDIRKAVSAVDKAAKKNIIHKNKAARIKSALSKLLIKKSKPPKSKEVKKAQKKHNPAPQNKVTLDASYTES